MINLNQYKTTNELADEMRAISNEINLPLYFKEDLEIDIKALDRYENIPKIWSLREAGSVLVPLNLGVDPVYVTHYMKDSVFFYIDSNLNINKLDSSKAKELIMKAPAILNRKMTKTEVFDVVDGVLNKGAKYGVWGIFKPITKESFSSWKEWLNHFQSSGNKVMIDFMAEAIRIQNVK